VGEGLHQIGEVAARTKLSLRTIRYYEEIGLVVPSGRSPGGFRLYSDADVQRLMLVKHMKPLELSLEQMRELRELFDALDADRAEHDDRLVERLGMFAALADARVQVLRAQLDSAEQFAAELRRRMARVKPAAPRRGR
jgi:MerR family copper efflux transcriptional regulator